MANAFKDELPRELVIHISAICGSQGEKWFEELPGMIGKLERRWSISVDSPFPGIEYNFVAPAVSKMGDRCVVKISPPFEKIEIFAEAKYLQTRDGQGTVRLLAEEREMRAILIEHALPGEALFHCFRDDPLACVQPAIKVLRSILRLPPNDMTDVDTLDNWFRNLRRYSETDFPKNYAGKALKIYEQNSTQPRRSYYLHGDFHPGNIITSDRVPFLAIDPKGIVGHLGYDIAVFLNNLHWWQKGKANVKELLNGAINQFAAAFAFEEKELREWAFAHMVVGAWWNFKDMPELYDGDLAISDIWDV